MPISIIIPSFNRNKILVKTLLALDEFAFEMKPEIIVVNDSKTNEVDVSTIQYPIKVIKNPKSGVASARNFGLQHATHDKLVFIDDDIIVSKEAISFISNFLNEKGDACINLDWVYPVDLQKSIGKTKFGRYLVKNGHADLKGWMGKDAWKEGDLYSISVISSAILGITKTSVNKINGYEENFPYAGFEDYDFAIRLRKNGIEGFLNTSITVFHNEEDRLDMRPWLERRKRNGETRAIGVIKFGYESHRINYSKFKDISFSLIYFFRGLYMAWLYLIPNASSLDKLYAKLFNPLLGAYIHWGYKMGIRK